MVYFKLLLCVELERADSCRGLALLPVEQSFRLSCGIGMGVGGQQVTLWMDGWMDPLLDNVFVLSIL